MIAFRNTILSAAKVAVFAWIFCFANSNVWAQNFWSFSNGPYGGTSANTLLLSPAGFLFASSGTDVFRSADKGISLTHVHSFNYPEAVYCLAMNSKGHHFVGNAAHVIDVSIDNGATWVERQILGATFTNALYAANDVLYAANGSGIYTSSDEANTWKAYDEGSSLDNAVGFAPLGNRRTAAGRDPPISTGYL